MCQYNRDYLALLTGIGTKTAANKRKHVTLSFGEARSVLMLAPQIVFVHRV